MVKEALLLYWSKTGNTEKVSMVIKEGLEGAELKVTMKRVEEAEDVDFLGYDLVVFGSPTYQWHPPPLVDAFLKKKYDLYCRQGKIALCAPKIPGKNALIVCTYAGPHTGINEAIPVGKYIGQFFEHIGFNILDEWYILSEYRGWKEGNTEGKMGDIQGKPTQEDLLKIRNNAEKIGKNLN